jgi:hypothetical protein
MVCVNRPLLDSVPPLVTPHRRRSAAQKSRADGNIQFSAFKHNFWTNTISKRRYWPHSELRPAGCTLCKPVVCVSSCPHPCHMRRPSYLPLPSMYCTVSSTTPHATPGQFRPHVANSLRTARTSRTLSQPIRQSHVTDPNVATCCSATVITRPTPNFNVFIESADTQTAMQSVPLGHAQSECQSMCTLASPLPSTRPPA